MKKTILLLANLLLVGMCMYAQVPENTGDQPADNQQIIMKTDVVSQSPTRLAGTEPDPAAQSTPSQLTEAEEATRAYLTSEAYAQAILERMKMFREKGDQKSVEKLEAELKRVQALKE